MIFYANKYFRMSFEKNFTTVIKINNLFYGTHKQHLVSFGH